MGSSCSRRFGVKVKVCAALGLLLVTWPRSASAEVLDLPSTETEPGVVIHAAAGDEPHRITVVLHGMCGHAENICRIFAGEATAGEHLVCPRASERCGSGGASWSQVGFEAGIERAVTRAQLALGRRVDETGGRTLIGYSLGAFRALQLVQQPGRKYQRVMLIGARINPSSGRLLDGGVERLLLAAGSWDMTFDHMRRESLRLSRAGVSTKFLGLGQAGHAFGTDFAERYLPEAWRWLHAP